MGCCTTIQRVDEFTLLTDYEQVNTLPTYENIINVYNELALPIFEEEQLPHKKEQMIFMIINMVRTNPQLYLQAL